MTSVALGAEYRRLWTATALTNVGDGIRAAALPLLAASLTGRSWSRVWPWRRRYHGCFLVLRPVPWWTGWTGGAYWPLWTLGGPLC